MIHQFLPCLMTHEHSGSSLSKEEETIFEEHTNVAVIHGGTQITYGDLNKRANHLAWYLQRSLGLGQKEVIAVCLDRSIECIASLLAVAKLGCAYLPIDPSWPSSVKAFHLEDAHVACILTLPQFATDLPAKLMLVYLDDDWTRVTALPGEVNPPHTCDTNLLALISLLLSWLK